MKIMDSAQVNCDFLQKKKTNFSFKVFLDPGPNQSSRFFNNNKMHSITEDMAKIMISEFPTKNNIIN